MQLFDSISDLPNRLSSSRRLSFSGAFISASGVFSPAFKILAKALRPFSVFQPALQKRKKGTEVLSSTHFVKLIEIEWRKVASVKLTIIGSDYGLLPGRHQAITLTNAGMVLIRPLGKKISEIFIEIQTFPFKKMHLKTSSAKWRPFCPGLDVFIKGIVEEYPWNLDTWDIKISLPWLSYEVLC